MLIGQPHEAYDAIGGIEIGMALDNKYDVLTLKNVVN